MSPEIMASLIDLAQKLSGASLAAILIGVLVGSYRGVWVWGFQLKKCEEEGAQWKAMALQAAGLAETSIGIVKRTGP